jgi:peptidoglycan biosynthesis protein MviN/MurJ (putative lipid II flippase)
MLQGMDEAKTPALIHLAEAIINVALSIVLGLTLGLVGVALATLIAAVVTNLLVFVPYLCRRFAVPLHELVGTVAGAHLPPLLVAGALGALLLRADPEGLLEVVGAVAGILGLYLLVFAVSGLSREERQRIRAAIPR